MATIKKNMNIMAMPLAMGRTEPQPLDTTSIWYSLESAQNYATTNGAAYVGQILTVVDESNSKATAYIIKDTAGNLQEVGSGTASPMLFVDSESAMLALTDIEAGQQVYRTDTKTIWIFKGGDAGQLSNWVESASQNDTVWSGTQSKVIFSALTEDGYRLTTPKDENTLYFITDSGKIYKGSTDVTRSVKIVSSLPTVPSSIPGMIYGVAGGENQGYSFVVSTGTEYVTINPGYYTDGANWAEADSGKFATIGLIKSAINSAVETLNNKFTTDHIAHGITYDEATLKITIPQYGQNDLVINIPKDKFLSNVEYDPSTQELVFTVDNGNTVRVPVAEFVKVYTADNTNKDVLVTISEDNKISAVAKIDDTAGNILSTSDKGLVVKLSTAASGKILTADESGYIKESAIAVNDLVSKVVGVEGNFITFGANGALTDTGYKAGGATLATTTNDKTLATEKAVETAIESAKLKWNVLE